MLEEIYAETKFGKVKHVNISSILELFARPLRTFKVRAAATMQTILCNEIAGNRQDCWPTLFNPFNYSNPPRKISLKYF